MIIPSLLQTAELCEKWLNLQNINLVSYALQLNRISMFSAKAKRSKYLRLIHQTFVYPIHQIFRATHSQKKGMVGPSYKPISICYTGILLNED